MIAASARPGGAWKRPCYELRLAATSTGPGQKAQYMVRPAATSWVRKAQPLIELCGIWELGEAETQGVTKVRQVVFIRLDSDLVPVLSLELLSRRQRTLRPAATCLSTPRQFSKKACNARGARCSQKLLLALRELGGAHAPKESPAPESGRKMSP